MGVGRVWAHSIATASICASDCLNAKIPLRPKDTDRSLDSGKWLAFSNSPLSSVLERGNLPVKTTSSGSHQSGQSGKPVAAGKYRLRQDRLGQGQMVSQQPLEDGS